MYEVCQRARRVISSILDRILTVNPPALPATLPPDVLATNWLNGEIVVLDDGTDLFRWIDGSSDTSRRGSWA